MPAIKIEFFKVGVRVSTWVGDDWKSLGADEKERLVREYAELVYPNEIRMSANRHVEPYDKQYMWSEM